MLVETVAKSKLGDIGREVVHFLVEIPAKSEVSK